jgi:predicted TIM-barrel fold metal-dependent hydrolase
MFIEFTRIHLSNAAMRIRFSFLLIIIFSTVLFAREGSKVPLKPGYEQRIRDYIDTMRIIDTHEHMFNPEALKTTHFLDFTLMLHQNRYDDLISSGMPDSVYNELFNKPVTALAKWKIVEPYWKKSFNTASNRVILNAVRDLYGISELNDSTIELLSSRMKEAYNGDWFNYVLREQCRFDYVLQESDFVGVNSSYVRYSDKFSDWLTVRTKFRIDSLAASQVEPIYTLDDYVSSMRRAFEEAIKMGMVAVKVNIAYARPLNFDNVSPEIAKKVFHKLTSGNENFELAFKDAKPLQDYMLHQLLEFARQYKLPVAFHTGMQAGSGNVLINSDPVLLTNLFFEFPDIKFVLYHGSYPFGGTLSVLVKTFRNVYLDMNWTYSVSPAYAERFLSEWLDTAPVSKIMAFGGDQRCVENTYGELIIAKKVISDVLIDKVKNGYLTESEAKTVGKMILRDNGVEFYNLN